MIKHSLYNGDGKIVDFVMGVQTQEALERWRASREKERGMHLTLKSEVDWNKNIGAIQWAETNPNHSITRSLLFAHFRLKCPEELKTTEEIKEFYNNNCQRVSSPPVACAYSNRATDNEPSISIDFSSDRTVYGRANYNATESTSGDFTLSVNMIREIIAERDGDIDEIRNEIESAIEDSISNGDYDDNEETTDYDYSDHTTTDSDSRNIRFDLPREIRQMIDEYNNRNDEE